MTKRPPKITASFRIDPDLWAKAEAKAEARGELRAEVIRRALERYVRSAK
jgi:predicted transcriptional regulator